MISKGYPPEFATIVATELSTEYTSRRMMGYLSAQGTLPLEDVADEMLYILSEREKFKNKHMSQNAQQAINEFYNLDLDD